MRKRLIGGLLCGLLLWSTMPAALASGEIEEELIAEEMLLPEEVANASEAPIPSEEDEGELPLSEDLDWHGLDPEDPLRGRIQHLDGDYGTTWSEFIPRSHDGETLHYGIDVSAYQNDIDWAKAKAAGVEFVFIRAAYRLTKSGALAPDSCFESHVKGAKAAGLKVGLYIFSQAITVKEAEDEAELLLGLAANYDIDLPLVFDLEHYPNGRFSNAGLSRREVTDLCLAFCAKVEQAGYESMVYSNPSMLKADMYAEELDRLWLANYTTQTSYTTHPYEFWQCSDKGVVDGVRYNGKATAVDLDIWFEPGVSAMTNPFTDVKEGTWYHDAVLAAYRAGIVKGMTDTTFQPAGTTTRGQLVTMLYRMAGEPDCTASATFTDLTQSWYRDPVRWAASLGIVKGYSDTEFRPGQAITREELVTILYRRQGEPKTDCDLSVYTDAASIHSWARDAMKWAVAKGIVSGYEDGTLRPRVDASRAVVCTILGRMDGLDA